MKTVAVNFAFMLVSLLAVFVSRAYRIIGWQIWILVTLCFVGIIILDLRTLYLRRKTQRGIKNDQS